MNSSSYEVAHKGTDVSRAVEEIINGVSNLLEDPWFSSLWILQESVLQIHALLLDKRGQPISTYGPWIGASPFSELLDVSGVCAMARHVIDGMLSMGRAESQGRGLSPQLRRMQELRTLVRESGLGFMLWSNPNIHYAAARFRKRLQIT